MRRRPRVCRWRQVSLMAAVLVDLQLEAPAEVRAQAGYQLAVDIGELANAVERNGVAQDERREVWAMARKVFDDRG